MLLNYSGMDTKKCKGYYYNELTIEKWEEYRDFLCSWRDKVIINDYAFRGHADNSWELKSTLERMRPELKNDITASWYRSAEMQTIIQYTNAVNIFKNNIIVNNIIEKLAFMQHYGAATRLLDITFSPFVATYFALSSIENIGKVKCIWAFPFKKINDSNRKELNIKTMDDLYAYYNNLDIDDIDGKEIIGISSFNNHVNKRQFHQQGAFLFSMSNKNNFETLLEKYFPDDSSELIKINFKISGRNDFAHAINDLRSMNLTYSSLFPDLVGYGKETYIDQYIINT